MLKPMSSKVHGAYNAFLITWLANHPHITMAEGVLNISAFCDIKAWKTIQILLTSKNLVEEQMTEFSYMARSPAT